MNGLLSRIIDHGEGSTILPKDSAVQKVVYYKKKKTLNFFFISDDVILKRTLKDLENKIRNMIPFVKEVNFFIKYKQMKLDRKDFRMDYWQNILYELNETVSSAMAWLNHANIQFVNDSLLIRVENHLAVEDLKNKKIDVFIQEMIQSEFNQTVKVIFQSDQNSEHHSKVIYLKEKEMETQKLIQDMIIESNQSTKAEHPNDKNQNKVIFGKPFSEPVISIHDIHEEGSTAVVHGEILSIEKKELQNGKTLFILSITDYKGSIGIKVFLKQQQLESFSQKVFKEKWIRVKGEVRYDPFLKEMIIIANAIMEENPKTREDRSKEKRIEFHAHTQMSAMDATSSATALIKRAAEWGHPAVAITDHGVVQAFPEAMEAGKKYGIKIIYGVEGYLVNDGQPIVINGDEDSIVRNYVVFDIETTGLSSKKDKIIEIGAVKIQDNQIVDRFSALIDPQIPIPSQIVQLTGITDKMVRGRPSIAEILPSFLEFVGECPVVAHNAGFDTSFIKENCIQLGLSFSNTIIDTLGLARILMPNLKKHRLDVVAKALHIELNNHHRAVEDAEATAKIFINFLDLLKKKGIERLSEINSLSAQLTDITKQETFHIILLAQNQVGLKNLYKIISLSHMDYFYKRPRIPKSLLTQMREGLIVGSACEAGELYRALLNNRTSQEIENIVKYYDYLEIQPLANNQFLIERGLVEDEEDLKELNKQIVELGKKFNKPVLATGDVHFLDPHDEIYRRILMAGQGYSDADNQAPLYFKTTEEMLNEFAYLGEENAFDVVVRYPALVAESIEGLIPIPQETFPPVIEGADDTLREMCYKKAIEIYGDPLPGPVKTRLDKELNAIIRNGYAVLYIIAHKLVAKSMQDGYLVGSRGSVGSSFVATMSDITEVNPLPPHYICPHCKHSEFITDGSVGSGIDLPDKNCPVCGTKYKKDGHDIPFEVFLGFEGDKEPDIDLNFAGEYQSKAHQYTEELFGKGYVFRAGTIATIAEKTAYGFVKKYYEEKKLPIHNREIDRLLKGCTGVKRTTGQHPGGVMVVPNHKDIFDFSPIQYPANDNTSGVITTHFDYHSISGRLLKLDILGHDVPTIIRMLQDITEVDPRNIPLDDKETIKIFTGIESLNILDKEYDLEVGTLGIPEFGTKFVRQMLIDTKPTTFAELVRISGLSHGTDVWVNNAQDLVRQNIAELKDVISTRDDIMNYLILKGLPAKDAFKIMEKVRKGKGLTEEDKALMKENDVPQWYIESCMKIKYMFPKAHAVAYVMMSFRLAYFKVHYPLAFYATYFTTKASDFDSDLIIKGKKVVKDKIKELENHFNELSQRDKDLLTVLEVAYEMYCRGFGFLPVDIYRSDANQFIIMGNNLLPPLVSLQGVGENAAHNICKAREKSKFISVEDLRQRAKVSKTVIETLKKHGCLDGLPDDDQLSLF